MIIPLKKPIFTNRQKISAMITKTALILLCALCFLYSFEVAGQNCPCCSEQYRQFDFWVGDWHVYDTAGNLVGTNSMRSMQDSCLLQEKYWLSGYRYFPG